MSHETIYTLKDFFFSFFEIDGPWKDFTAVTKLIKRFKSVDVLEDDYNNIELTSWKARVYGIFMRVSEVS